MLKPYQERVVQEQLDLATKISKLTEFIKGELFLTLDEYERERLQRQLEYMTKYYTILVERIAHFK